MANLAALRPWLVLLVAMAAVLSWPDAQTTADALGTNWGTQVTHPLPPKIVVKMLHDNDINKVKLFDADEGTLSTLAGTGIDVMVATPNVKLNSMTDYDTAKEWVIQNVSRYNFDGGVTIK